MRGVAAAFGLLLTLMLPSTPAAAVPPNPTDLVADALLRVQQAYAFTGDIQVEHDGKVARLTRGDAAADRRWPWESTTKQILATMVMQAVERGELSLDAPLASYLVLPTSGDLSFPTVRQLLQHRSGLRNSDDSPKDAAGMPDFYTTGATGIDWCLADRKAPSETQWRYNNCDYIVLAAVLERATAIPVATLFHDRIAVPAGLSADTGLLTGDDPFYGRDRDYAQLLPRFGWSGALAGPIADLIRFDQALEDGRLIGPKARAEMWDGNPKLGFMALGQWVFEAPLKGCAKPVRIVERRGGIGNYQTRNIILPDLHREIVVMTIDGEFDFGEIWQGKGFSYDLLSAAACSDSRD